MKSVATGTYFTLDTMASFKTSSDRLSNNPLHRSERNILDMFLSDPRTCNLHTCHTTSVHVAVIVKRGKILAEASNRIGSRSSGSGYSKNTIHAEKNVVKALGDISLLRGADLYVMRLTHDKMKTGLNRFLGSEPCNSCKLFLAKCIKEYGLKGVYWTG